MVDGIPALYVRALDQGEGDCSQIIVYNVLHGTSPPLQVFQMNLYFELTRRGATLSRERLLGQYMAEFTCRVEFMLSGNAA